MEPTAPASPGILWAPFRPEHRGCGSALLGVHCSTVPPASPVEGNRWNALVWCVYEGTDSAQLHLLVCCLHRCACLTRNLCISLTCFCLCNSPNMLGVSPAANRGEQLLSVRQPPPSHQGCDCFLGFAVMPRSFIPTAHIIQGPHTFHVIDELSSVEPWEVSITMGSWVTDQI